MQKTVLSMIGISLLMAASLTQAATTRATTPDPFVQGVNRCMSNPRADFKDCAFNAARVVGAKSVDMKLPITLGGDVGDPTADEVCVGDGDSCTLYECNGSGMSSDVCFPIGYCFEDEDSSHCVYDAEE